LLAIAALASLSPPQLQSGLLAIDPADLLKLKLTCADVLANPSANSPEAVAVCQVVASL
jgi:hypothetical protein